MDSNGTILPASSHYPIMETGSQVSGIDTEGNPSLASDPDEQSQDEQRTLHLFNDVEYLASLPRSVLKELPKNITKALATPKQASNEAIESRGESSLQALGKRAARSAASKSSTISAVLRCEYAGCTTTFGRNKDRRRHFRHKHGSNTKTFPCPVVDCPSGFGHQFDRSDKLREHLRTKKILDLIYWSCVIPGCSEIPGGRASLIDHLGQHDRNTRRSNENLLKDYGFASRNVSDYLWAEYICSIPECPFGADDKDNMDAHLTIHHDGPFCPCPIPSCQRVSQDYNSAITHLAREHDYDTRIRFRKEIYSQRLSPEDAIFLCPICHKEVKQASQYNVRDHCLKHNHQELLRVSEALVKTWTFSFGPITHGHGLEQFTITGNMILPYIFFPNRRIQRLDTKTDLEQAVARIRVAIERNKNTQLS